MTTTTDDMRTTAQHANKRPKIWVCFFSFFLFLLLTTFYNRLRIPPLLPPLLPPPHNERRTTSGRCATNNYHKQGTTNGTTTNRPTTTTAMGDDSYPLWEGLFFTGTFFFLVYFFFLLYLWSFTGATKYDDENAQEMSYDVSWACGIFIIFYHFFFVSLTFFIDTTHLFSDIYHLRRQWP